MSKKPPRRGREGEKGETREVGRPLITLKDLPENWEALMTSIYQVGGTDVEVRVALAVPPCRALSHETWTKLKETYPEFLEAVQSGTALAETWMYQQARAGMFHPNFKPKIWHMLMRNRFGFKGGDANFVPGSTGEEKKRIQFYLPDNGRGKKVS